MTATPADHKALRNAAERQRHWTQERDRLIVEAVKAGGSLRDVGDAVGMSHSAVAKIVKRTES